MFKMKSVQDKKEGRKKQPEKDPILERKGERVYVLPCMVVTFPTSQVERSPLKAAASLNTAPPRHTAAKQRKDQ